jgi:glutamate-ammonia-ligase adenylyltransferase
MNHSAARTHSPWFHRTLDALSRRHPELAALLPGLCARPLSPAVIDALWERVTQYVQASARGATPPLLPDPGPALRLTRQIINLTLIDRDVRQCASLDEVCQAQSHWAQRAITVAARHAARELSQEFGVALDAQGQAQDLLIVAMGKLGGQELNVSSDIDLVYVHRDHGDTAGGPTTGRRLAATDFFHRVARRIGGLLSDCNAEGFVFRVDTRLRPHGDAGPLTVTLPMLERYLGEQGREWERFAWLKAAVMADTGMASGAAVAADTAALHAIVTPFVYRRYLDFQAFDALREVHRLIRNEAERRDARRDQRDGGGFDVKLGRGGIREIEFCAQLFQVVRGGRDSRLRQPSTRATLRTLAEHKLLEPATAQALDEAYVLLRRVEHALQYQEDAQTHRLPDNPALHTRIAAMLGLGHAEFDQQLSVARTQVMAVFDALLGHPSADDTVTKPALHLDEAGHARVKALHHGRRYRLARPETQARIDRLLQRALQEGLSSPLHDVSTHASHPDYAQTTWLGRLLDWLETVAGRPAYLALLEQFPNAYRRLLLMIGQAKWAADYLTRHPVVLDELLDGQILTPPSFATWEQDLRARLHANGHDRQPDVEYQMDVLREGHHAQVFRLLVQDLNGSLSVERLSDHLSELAERILAIALDLVWQQLRDAHRPDPRFAVIAYGRLGGKELGYASDLDLVFLYDDLEATQPIYTQLGQKLCGWLATRTAAGQIFDVDLRLRPNGEAGLPTISLSAFARYQQHSAWVWEHQALTRARFVAGNQDLGAAFEALRRTILASPRAQAPLAAEVCAMRQKMRQGHPNRSALFDLKHDPGGMVDIEFIVQYLVLAHAAHHPCLLENAGNIALLEQAAQAALIPADAARACAQAYRTLRRIQHSLRLNDARFARIDPATVTIERAAVQSLWAQLFAS